MSYEEIIESIENSKTLIQNYKTSLQQRPGGIAHNMVREQKTKLLLEINELKKVTAALLPPGEKCKFCNGTGKKLNQRNKRFLPRSRTL